MYIVGNQPVAFLSVLTADVSLSYIFVTTFKGWGKIRHIYINSYFPVNRWSVIEKKQVTSTPLPPPQYQKFGSAFTKEDLYTRSMGFRVTFVLAANGIL